MKWLAFRLKLLGSAISTAVALLVAPCRKVIGHGLFSASNVDFRWIFGAMFYLLEVLHSYLGPLGRAISGPAAGLALRYAQQLSGAMEGHLADI